MRSLIASLYQVFVTTAILTHIWTVIIAFIHGGFLAGVVSLFLPFLSEIYWMFKMFGTNDFYAIVALIHLILSVVFFFAYRG